MEIKSELISQNSNVGTQALNIKGINKIVLHFCSGEIKYFEFLI